MVGSGRNELRFLIFNVKCLFFDIMLKLLSISLLLMGYCSFQQAPPRVVRKMTAHRVHEVYNGIGTDSLINFKGKKYFVNWIEDYDESSKLIKFSIWKPLGYLAFSEKNVIHAQKFQKDYGLRDTLAYRKLKDDKVLLNSVVYTIKGKEKDRLYLVRSSEKEKLYILEFKL